MRRAGWRSWPQRGSGYLVRLFNAATGLPAMAVVRRVDVSVFATRALEDLLEILEST